MTERRPLVTFALCSYNQERFIGEALGSALAQTYQPLEIILSDDASTDRTVEVARDVIAATRSPHRVTLLVAERNEGIGASINRIMTRARGALIVVGAGDDVSVPHRVARLVERWEASGRTAHSLYSNGWVMDERGRRERPFYPCPPDQRRHTLPMILRDGCALLGAAHAWDRRVFDVFGPLAPGVIYEDWALPFRSALLGTVEYVDELLVDYRRHAGNTYLGAESKDDLDAWRASQLRRVAQYRVVHEGWLRDLATAASIMPQRESEIARIRKATERRQRVLEDRLELLAGAPFTRRLALTLRQTLRVLPPRQLAEWIMTFYFPRTYLRRLRRNAGLIEARTASG